MCLVLPARVLAVNGQTADVELYGGMPATVSLALRPEVEVGHYVMVDRGLILEIIEPAEAEAILAMYDEIGQMLGEADAAPPPMPVPVPRDRGKEGSGQAGQAEPAWVEGGRRG